MSNDSDNKKAPTPARSIPLDPAHIEDSINALMSANQALHSVIEQQQAHLQRITNLNQDLANTVACLIETHGVIVPGRRGRTLSVNKSIVGGLEGAIIDVGNDGDDETGRVYYSVVSAADQRDGEKAVTAGADVRVGSITRTKREH